MRKLVSPAAGAPLVCSGADWLQFQPIRIAVIAVKVRVSVFFIVELRFYIGGRIAPKRQRGDDSLATPLHNWRAQNHLTEMGQLWSGHAIFSQLVSVSVRVERGDGVLLEPSRATGSPTRFLSGKSRSGSRCWWAETR